MTDALAAIKYHVYDTEHAQHGRSCSRRWPTISQGHERMRQLLLNRTPRYGNDDDYADDVMVEVFEAYFEAIDGRPNTKGGHYRINLLPTTCHVYFGAVIGAHAGRPLCRARRFPKAFRRCRARIGMGRPRSSSRRPRWTTRAPAARCSTRSSRPSCWPDDEGLTKLSQLVRTYFKLDGHHIQPSPKLRS